MYARRPTAQETADALALALGKRGFALAVVIYRLWNVEQIWHILRDTMRESVMILTIIAASVVFGYMLTSLYLTPRFLM